MAKKEQTAGKVVEAEFTDVKPAVRCAITVGMTEAGDIFFNVEGSDQSLINMEGLLKYADRHMERIWAQRLDAVEQEKTEE